MATLEFSLWQVMLLAASMLLIGNLGGFLLARGLEKLAWQEVEIDHDYH